MLYREIIAVCSEIHIKTHKYTVWTERREFKHLIYSTFIALIWNIKCIKDQQTYFNLMDALYCVSSTQGGFFDNRIQL